jgi:DNA-binding NarL/FixJ family response regulator
MESQSRFARQNISMVIVDSVAITCELLTQAFSSQSGFAILGCPKSRAELDEILSRQAPDVAIVRSSEKKGPFSALAILDAIHTISPRTRSIVLSADITRDDVVAYFHSQARGILSADHTDFATLCKCISRVRDGEIWASNQQLNYLIESLSGAKRLHVIEGRGESLLSAREQEVLCLLAEGRSNRAMAEALNLSEHTIKNHLFHIFYKLGVSNRTEAILYVIGRKSGPEQKVDTKPEPPKLDQTTIEKVAS